MAATGAGNRMYGDPLPYIEFFTCTLDHALPEWLF
jgi:hypothetical protein